MKRNQKVEIIPFCSCCGTTKISEFYASSSLINKITKKMSICKACVDLQYNEYLKKYGDSQIAIYYTCRKFDLPFSLSAYNGAKNTAITKGWTVLQSYFKEINSGIGQSNNYGVCFDESLDSLELNNANNKISNYNTSFDVNYDIIRFWGNNFSPEEYEFLTTKIEEYLGAFECETPVMEELFKQASFESLEIRNKRQRKEDVSKNLKNLQDLLGSANIKPNQETGSNATDQTTYGTLIKKFENEEPIPEPDDEWKDVDGIGKYFRVWFLGHLCKMMGISNEYSKEYEEEMEKLRVSVPSGVIDEEMNEGE